MARSKLLSSLLAIVAFCAMAGTSFAFLLQPVPSCPNLNGSYAFYFWDPDSNIAGSGVFSLQRPPRTVFKGTCLYNVIEGEIRCNADGLEYLSEIEDGSVSVAGGEGTMWVETISDQICGIAEAIEFDVAAVSGGSTILFTSNGSEYVLGNTNLPNAGFGEYFRGRADNAFATTNITGCYNLNFWAADGDTVGDCNLCFGSSRPPTREIGSSGPTIRAICPLCQPAITGGDCRCNSDGTEFSWSITTGQYFVETDGEGTLYFESSTNQICGGRAAYLDLDFALANGGKEIVGNCNAVQYILSGTVLNAGADLACAFEGYQY